MRYRVIVATALLFGSMDARAFLSGADQALPVKDGRPAVAIVNGEPIALDQFLMELDPAADQTQPAQGYGTPSQFELLGRLVNIKLIVQEAATMGLDEQPEIRKQVDVSARGILRDVLMERLVNDVKPDEAAVDALFKEMVREWKTASLLFQDEASARRAREEIAAGGNFAEVAARAVAAKAARTEGDEEYHSRKDYLPQIADAIATLQPRQVSPVIALKAGFVVVTLIDIRYPENREARAEARKRIVGKQQLAVLQAHDEALRHDSVTIRTDVLGGLDFAAATPGLAALQSDTRVVADIKGAAPVTVGDLTEYLRMQSFHGPDQAAQGKRMNATKEAALEAMLGRRLLNLEATRLGLDKTAEYRDRVKAYEESLVFDSFVQKVIVPDSKMTDEEVRRYYDAHLEEFSSPEMLRIRSVAFSGRGAAEDAMRKLQDGADYAWLVANADGQVAKGTEGVLTLDGRPVMTGSMPEGVRKVLAGAKGGDYKLYSSPEGPFYVLAVQAAIAPAAKPYDEVRDEIAKKLYGQKLKRNVDDYLDKLRAAGTIEIYLKKVQ